MSVVPDESLVIEAQIGEGITAIGYSAFSNGLHLQRVSLPSTLTSIGFYAFDGCESLTTATLPVNLVEIGVFAFGSTALETLVIPASVTSIGIAAFAIPSLTRIDVTGSNAIYASDNGVLFTKDMSTLLCLPGAYSTRYTTPAATVEIDYFAFAFSTTLRAVTLTSVITVGPMAFLQCSELGSVNLGTALVSLESQAFLRCPSLTQITLPATLQQIGSQVFAQSAIRTISLSGAIPNVDPEAFLEATSLSVFRISGEISESLCTALIAVLPTPTIYILDIPNFVDGSKVCDNALTAFLYRDPTSPPPDYVPPPATPVPTVDVQRSAHPIEATSDTEIHVEDIPVGVPVTITGEGDKTSIVGVSNDGPASLHFANLTVKGKEVTISDLEVDAYLELQEGVVLKPPDGESISMRNDVEIKLVSSTVGKLPQLDLGVTAVEIVPQAVQVVVDEAIAGDVRQLIVKGKPFNKCDEWKDALAGLPSDVKGECDGVTSGRILASGERGLYLVRKEGEDDGGPPIAIIAAVVGVVVVIVIAVIIYLKCKNKDDGSAKDKGRSRSKSKSKSKSRSRSHRRRRHSYSYSDSYSPSV
jgi:hypothetical protein